MPWFKGWSKETKGGLIKGMTLLDAIDATECPTRCPERPLRLPIQNVYTIGGVGTVFQGCVAYGVIKAAMVLAFTPTNVVAKVKSIEMHHERREVGLSGETVGVCVQ